MRAFRLIRLLLLVLPLTLVLLNSASVLAAEEKMKSFFNSEMTGVTIGVKATQLVEPGQSVTVVMTVNTTFHVHIERIGLEIFGFVNGTDQLSIGNVSDGDFDLNDTLKEYVITTTVPNNVWGSTYGEIRLTYSVNMGGAILQFPNIINGFPLTPVENTLVKSLEEQIKSLNESYSQLSQMYANLTNAFINLNQSYWNLQGNYTSAQNSLGELDNTRRLSTILAITTVFFLATTVYIVVRRPRDYW